LAKPFSIQAPEDVAKEYGGNKQRIAQAAQMGIVDPTAAVLAGMFIDRMRSAQVMEGGQQPTVAQQVLGGGGLPTPPTNPMAPGMGAPAPQPAPPMQAPMGAPMGAPPAPMPGMAMGGIASLPIPGAMFDEPDNGGYGDGYAGGGLVAFADGGDVDAETLERLRRAIIAQESGGDYGITNREGSGAMGAYQFMPDTARALAKRLGVPYRPDLLAGPKARTKEGRAYQDRLGTEQLGDALRFGGGDISKAAAFHFAGPNKAGWKSKTAKYQQDILRRLGEGEPNVPLRERNIQSPEGRRATFEDQLGVARDLFSTLPDSGLGEAAEFYKKEVSEETRKKNRKDDMWMAIAQLGGALASSDSPNFLQAAGQAIARTMPGVDATKKERKAAERSAMNALTDIYGLQRKEAKEVFDFGARLAETEMSAEAAETAREFARSERIAGQQFSREEREANKNVEEKLVDAYFRQFKTQGMDDDRAYRVAVIAAKQAIEGTKPQKANSSAAASERLEGIVGRTTGGGGVATLRFDAEGNLIQ
jgi:hypothetical protein